MPSSAIETLQQQGGAGLYVIKSVEQEEEVPPNIRITGSGDATGTLGRWKRELISSRTQIINSPQSTLTPCHVSGELWA